MSPVPTTRGDIFVRHVHVLAIPAVHVCVCVCSPSLGSWTVMCSGILRAWGCPRAAWLAFSLRTVVLGGLAFPFVLPTIVPTGTHFLCLRSYLPESFLGRLVGVSCATGAVHPSRDEMSW